MEETARGRAPMMHNKGDKAPGPVGKEKEGDSLTKQQPGHNKHRQVSFLLPLPCAVYPRESNSLQPPRTKKEKINHLKNSPLFLPPTSGDPKGSTTRPTRAPTGSRGASTNNKSDKANPLGHLAMQNFHIIFFI